MKYKLIIFDFDGTLANTFPWFLTVMDEVSDKFELERINRDEIDMFRGLDAAQLIKYFKVPLWKIPVMGKYVMELMTHEIDKIPLFEGIDQVVRVLAEQGATLAVVSSNTYENVRTVLGPANADLFKYYECGVSIFGKPAKFRKILRKSGYQADETICIGDEIRDLQAAKKVKLPFGAVTWGYTRVDALEKYSPTEIFYSVAEIEQKLAN
jgi:phosphoglycolate phosphatase